MIREILSEIEKTDTHEDLSSFGEGNRLRTPLTRSIIMTSRPIIVPTSSSISENLKQFP